MAGFQDLFEDISNTESLLIKMYSVEPEALKDDARVKLLKATRVLSSRLETPWEFVQRTTWEEPISLMCLKIADDVDLFRFVGENASNPTSLDFLATATAVEKPFLKRILRHLTARRILANSSVSPNLYWATNISQALATREASCGIRLTCNVYYPSLLAFPKILQEEGYRTPTDSRNGVFQKQHNLQGLTVFEYFQRPENKHLAEDSAMFMKYTTEGWRSFLDVCDVKSLLRQEGRPLTESGYLLVDVGGGSGTDAVEFRTRFADCTGVMELQDLEGVIDTARAAHVENHGILLRVHNFFEVQPARGSRFYFMGSILHDWPDPDAQVILWNVRAAMKSNYSTLLLSENVLPDAGCRPNQSAIDLIMGIMLAGKERSAEDWHDLLQNVGLKIVKIHTIPSSLKSVLECEID